MSLSSPRLSQSAAHRGSLRSAARALAASIVIIGALVLAPTAEARAGSADLSIGQSDAPDPTMVGAHVFGGMTNAVSVADQADPKSGNNTASDDTTVAQPSADLSVTLVDSPDPVGVGQPLTYTVRVRNAGPDEATHVKVVDQLPSSVVFDAATPDVGSCKPPSAGSVACRLGVLPVGQAVQVVIVVYPTTNGTPTDTAGATAFQPDPVPADNAASQDTSVNGVTCSIVGTTGNDRALSGTGKDDVVCGLGGRDVISGLDGNDRLDGGPGDDTLRGGDGVDQLFGRAGDDGIGGGANFDLARFDGAVSGVIVDLPAGTATGEGSDSLSQAEGIVGSANADTLHGDAAANEIYGRAGDDQIFGGSGFDYARYDFASAGVSVDLQNGTASGAEGADALAGIEGVIGSNFADTLIGDGVGNKLGGRGGDDVIRGAGGVDYALFSFAPSAVHVDLGTFSATGGDGTDVLTGMEGILGSSYDDILSGDKGANRISGDAGADNIRGLDGKDAMFGGWGNDDVQGRRGDDYLDGGLGQDTLDGGANEDRCSASAKDRIVSCEHVTSPRAAGSGGAPIGVTPVRRDVIDGSPAG